MKLIVAGSRDFKNYEILKSKLDFLLKNTTGYIEIVSGAARGTDQLGERYAYEKGYGLKKFPAYWKGYGKQAGYIRNKQMAEYATHCVCFWDGISNGTAMMIELAKENGLKLRIVKNIAHGSRTQI